MTATADHEPSPHYRNIAAQAFAECAAHDMWFPKANPAATAALAIHLERWKLEHNDVIAGVRKMYTDNGSGFRPLPKDIVDASRAVRADRTERETTAERQAREDARDAQLEANRHRLQQLCQGFGKTPADA